MILAPKTEWEVIASEEPNADSIFLKFALPLIIAGAAVSAIGHTIVLGGGTYGTDALVQRGVY